MIIEIEEEQRQVILLALAKLSLSRPGFHPACLAPLAAKLKGLDMYEHFRSHGPDIPSMVDFAALDAAETDRQLDSLLAEVSAHTIGEQQRVAAGLIGVAQGCTMPTAKYAVHCLAVAVAGGLEPVTICAKYLYLFIEVFRAENAARKAVANS